MENENLLKSSFLEILDDQLAISIALKMIPKCDDQSNAEEPSSNRKRILTKDIQSKQIGVSQNRLDLNKYASYCRKKGHLRLKSTSNGLTE
jgi:hypothetical protein